MERLAASVFIGVLGFGALSGCTVNASANLTVSPSDVADSAAGALEEQIGIRPDMDCGDAQVDLVDGTVVDCVLTDPNTGSTFDAPVTIDGVDGTEYRVSVDVAETPRE